MRKSPLEQINKECCMDMADYSLEYKTISSLTSELVAALRCNLIEISVELQSTSPLVLNNSDADEVRSPYRLSELERATMLVRCIQKRVQADQACYYAFVGVLQKKPEYYGKVLEQLKLPETESIQRG